MSYSQKTYRYPKPDEKQSAPIRTTLYEMTEAVYDVAGRNGNELVTSVMLQLLGHCRCNVVLLEKEESLFDVFA
jgi:hypothetical protein